MKNRQHRRLFALLANIKAVTSSFAGQSDGLSFSSPLRRRRASAGLWLMSFESSCANATAPPADLQLACTSCAYFSTLHNME
jgi:hypothetical protein